MQGFTIQVTYRPCMVYAIHVRVRRARYGYYAFRYAFIQHELFIQIGILTRAGSIVECILRERLGTSMCSNSTNSHSKCTLLLYTYVPFQNVQDLRILSVGTLCYHKSFDGTCRTVPYQINFIGFRCSCCWRYKLKCRKARV